MKDSREIAKNEERNEATVSRAIASAFARGLVVVSRTIAKQRLNRDQELEYALRHRFHSLLSAIVVADGEYDPDPLHQRLGEAFAWEIFDGRQSIRRDDIIGMGAGRTLYHLAKYLVEEPEKLRVRGVKIVSLCGDSYPYHKVPKNVVLDADDNVNLFTQAFQHPAARATTSHSIFMSTNPLSEGDTDRLAHASYYGLWNKNPISFAFSGIGVFDENHQLVLLCQQNAAENFPPIRIDNTLREQINALWEDCRELQKQVGEPAWFPVAEVAMRLLVLPAPGQLHEKIRQAVDAINSHLFAPRPEHLKAIDSIGLLAGGADKVAALHWLLRSSGTGKTDFPPVSTVCTDSATAKAILARENSG